MYHVKRPFIKIFLAAFISRSTCLLHFLQLYILLHPGLYLDPQKLHVCVVYPSSTTITIFRLSIALNNKRVLNLYNLRAFMFLFNVLFSLPLTIPWLLILPYTIKSLFLSIWVIVFQCNSFIKLSCFLFILANVFFCIRFLAFCDFLCFILAFMVFSLVFNLANNSGLC